MPEIPSIIDSLPKELVDPAVATAAEVAKVLQPKGDQLEGYKSQFISECLAQKALMFGDFTLKSGRISPYFFNAGQLYTGSLVTQAAESYASSLLASVIGSDFDVLLGPAYKGIPLAAVTCMALSQKGVQKDYTYNRKEAKDHGEGGNMVGAPLEGRIVVIDDVMTSGVAIRGAIDIIAAHPKAELVGIIVLIDRQERGQKGDLSTIQEVSKEFKVPVIPIVGMDDIMKYMEESGTMDQDLNKMSAYRAQWGSKAI